MFKRTLAAEGAICTTEIGSHQLLLCVLKYVCVWCMVQQSPEEVPHPRVWNQGLGSVRVCYGWSSCPARLYTEGTGYTGNFTLSPILAIPEYHKREIANFGKIRALSHT
jgi:hypothetical protein